MYNTLMPGDASQTPTEVLERTARQAAGRLAQERPTYEQPAAVGDKPGLIVAGSRAIRSLLVVPPEAVAEVEVGASGQMRMVGYATGARGRAARPTRTTKALVVPWCIRVPCALRAAYC